MAKSIVNIQTNSGYFNDFFGPRTLFVPLPGSAPLLPRVDTLWVPKLIAEELLKYKLGVNVATVLHRTRAVQKSATAPPGQRPSIQTHLQSIEVTKLVTLGIDRIVMVDDVLTMGRTMCAAYIHLKQAYPDLPILGFAPFRTQGLIPDIEKLADADIGTITCNGVDCSRHP